MTIIFTKKNKLQIKMKTKVFILLIMTGLFVCSCKQTVQKDQSVQESTVQTSEYKKMITARVFIKPGRETDFIAAAQMMIENSNKEEGCLGYMLYQDPYEKTNFIFVESYKNQAAIDFHFETPYFKEFGTITADMTSKSAEVKILDIAGEK